MVPADIKSGCTYQVSLTGQVQRRVVEISTEQRPDAWGWCRAKHGPGVLYEQKGRLKRMYLVDFAAWAGVEVKS